MTSQWDGNCVKKMLCLGILALFHLVLENIMGGV